MSQVSKTGVEGAGRKGDSLEAGVKAMSSGLEMGTHLGRIQPGREAAVVAIRRARALGGPRTLGPPGSLQENRTGLGSEGGVSQSTRWHRGDRTTAWRRGQEGACQLS